MAHSQCVQKMSHVDGSLKVDSIASIQSADQCGPLEPLLEHEWRSNETEGLFVPQDLFSIALTPRFIFLHALEDARICTKLIFLTTCFTSIPTIRTTSCQLNATDADADAKLVYSLDNKHGREGNRTFVVTPEGGVRLMEGLDYESRTAYQLRILVTDSRFTERTTLHIHVIDVNDEVPQFALSQSQIVVQENQKARQLVAEVSSL
ncbi:unnamed protein product [Protopolystoma xenopodis]|uniref:Cadherin domain-containing protein n=1 Tax=Protopolystoma xenopodis TaxID=117903 RepID=A0A3S5BPY3_9PLAT|nr:unnamed protein product [Protopolystoma xenopodis]